MRVFVTGGGGFIGRNFIEAVGNDYEIVAPRSRELNLSNQAAVAAWFHKQKPFDVLVHTATTPAHRAASGTAGVIDSNLNMYFNLMRHRNKWNRMIVLTSGAVYDVTGAIENATENTVGSRIPGEPSGLSKLAIACHAKTQPNVVELRPFGVFGKYELYNIRFISNAICKALFGLPITLRQDRAFSYVYVNDLVNVIRHFCENPTVHPAHAAYNVTHPEHCSLAQLAHRVQQIVNPNVEIKIAESGLGLAYTGSSELLRKSVPALSFTPHDTAIAELADWYKANKSMINFSQLGKDI
jgi:GDP-L-fucose synthase